MTTAHAIPLAYFITFTCYGTWLHGNKETSVDRDHNVPQTPFVPLHYKRLICEQKRLSETKYILHTPQRYIVLKAIQETCTRHDWSLLAAHVRTNHVHLVVHSLIKPEIILTQIKLCASHCLNKSGLEISRKKRWTRHGSTKYLWKTENIESCIRYVIEEQGEPMAMYENKSRIIKF